MNVIGWRGLRPEGKRPLGRPKSRLEDTMKINAE